MSRRAHWSDRMRFGIVFLRFYFAAIRLIFACFSLRKFWRFQAGDSVRAACLQNETAPEKLLNRYEKRFEKREKRSEKRSEM